MFSFLLKKAGFWLAKKQTTEKLDSDKKQEDEKLSKSLDENLTKIREATKGSSDIVIREFVIGGCLNINAAIIFVDGLVNSKLINDNIIHPLMHNNHEGDRTEIHKNDIEIYLQKHLLSVTQVTAKEKISEVYSGFLSGDVTLLADGCGKALIISSKGWESRSVDEPASEAVIRGPRESFIENLRTNTSLIRRKIQNPDLTFESMVIGKRTRTNVCIAYIKGIADIKLIDTIKNRMAAIETDSILESGYIEQYIEDSPASIFATIGYTEKPDVAAAKILEGRAAIVVDGTPFVLTVPLMFTENFQSAEDYYFRTYYANLLRIIRVIAYLITILAPALYVAITTYHQELIPTNLLLTMASAREGIPFPAFFESLIMIITFEILREAGVRLPRPVGQALSIVGALVIGEAAVSAGIIGAPMVIVVAITAVSGFVIPNLADSAAVLRIMLLLFGATLGGFGITLGLLGTLVHLSALESFGYPYLSPFAPFNTVDSKDAIFRAPLWLMIKRPKDMAKDEQRKGFFVPPAGANRDENKESGQ